MTGRGWLVLLLGGVSLPLSLAMGNAPLFMLGVTLCSAWGVMGLSMLCVRLTLRTEQTFDETAVTRGGRVCRLIRIRMICPIPPAPAKLIVRKPNGKTASLRLTLRPIGETLHRLVFPARHVGRITTGAECLSMSDAFGLFRMNVRFRDGVRSALILPGTPMQRMLSESPGEGEKTVMERAGADRSAPSDTRYWQEGDELRRVHWKLSLRRGALLVRTYETPTRPDALLMPDYGAAGPEVYDELSERCAGLIREMLMAGQSVRLMLPDGRDLAGRSPEALGPMLRALAEGVGTSDYDFAKTVMGQSETLRRCGAACIYASELNDALTAALMRLTLSGAVLRLAVAEGAAVPEALVTRLIGAGVEIEMELSKNGGEKNDQ